MKSSTIIAALSTTTTATQSISNRMYIATSSSPALVNQWAVISSPGARLSWSRDARLASNLTVTPDSHYFDPTNNPGGLVLTDVDSSSSPLYAFGACDEDARFPRDKGVKVHTVRFAEPRTAGGKPVLPMVNNVVKSVELRSQNDAGDGEGLDVLQVCGGEENVPYYLIVADGYVSECQNVTLRYV